MAQASASITRRGGNRLASLGGIFDICDFRTTDVRTGSLLLSSVATLGVPAREDVARWVRNKFGNRVYANVGGIVTYERVPGHPQYVVLEVPVTMSHAGTKPAEMVASMTRVAPHRYTDGDGQIWHLEETGDGQKFLALVDNDDSLNRLLEASVRRTNSPRLRFQDVPREAGALTAKQGDKISFATEGGTKIMHGTISESHGDKVTVKVSGGGKHTIERNRILSVEPSASSQKADKEFVRDYFEKAYGDPDYAKQMVANVTEQALGDAAVAPKV